MPDLQAVAVVYEKIKELCNRDVTEKFLTLKELKCFNFLNLAFNLNRRHGPLIDLTWEAVEQVRDSGVIDCNEHKTGHFFNMKLKIHIEQFPWLERLKEESISKHGPIKKRVFGTYKDTEEHSMSKIIKKVLPKHFDNLSIINNDFNGNSIRKMWETYVYYNKGTMSADQGSFHKSQSAHGLATAENHYVNFPKPSEDVIDFYHNTLQREVNKLKRGPAESSSCPGTPSESKSVSKTETPVASTSVTERRKVRMIFTTSSLCHVNVSS